MMLLCLGIDSHPAFHYSYHSIKPAAPVSETESARKELDDDIRERTENTASLKDGISEKTRYGTHSDHQT